MCVVVCYENVFSLVRTDVVSCWSCLGGMSMSTYWVEVSDCTSTGSDGWVGDAVASLAVVWVDCVVGWATAWVCKGVCGFSWSSVFPATYVVVVYSCDGEDSMFIV